MNKKRKPVYQWIVHHASGQEGSEEAHRYLFKDHAKAQEWLDYKVKYYSAKWRMIKVIVQKVK